MAEDGDGDVGQRVVACIYSAADDGGGGIGAQRIEAEIDFDAIGNAVAVGIEGGEDLEGDESGGAVQWRR